MTYVRAYIVRIGVVISLGLLAAGALTGCTLLDILQPARPPATPTGVAASRGELEQAVRVSWQPVADAESYRVYWASAEDGDYQLVGETGGTTFTDAPTSSRSLEPGTWYWYRVQACNGAGCSALSRPASGYAGYPPAPTGIQASDGDYLDKVVITWDEVPGATSYQVFRDRTRDGTYNVLVGTTQTTTIEDRAASPGFRYWYAVRACNGFGCSWLSEDRDSGCVAPCPVGSSGRVIH